MADPDDDFEDDEDDGDPAPDPKPSNVVPLRRSTFSLENFKAFLATLRVDTKDEGEILLSWDRLKGTQRYVVLEIVRGLADGIHIFVILKGRQQGISTIMLAFDLYWMFKHKGMSGSLVTQDEKTRDDFKATITMYIEGLPKKFKVPIQVHNRTMFVAANRSKFSYQVAGTRKNSNLGKGKGLTYLHGCVPPGTPVIVEDGRLKPIEEVVEGEFVLTHTGAIAEVVAVIGQENRKGPMLGITPWLGKTLKFTRDHKIPTQRGTIEAQDVRMGDWLVMPVRKIRRERYGCSLPTTKDRPQGGGIRAPAQTLDYTEEVGFACGYYLAEGCPTGGRYVSGITFARHRDEKRYADRACEALAEFTVSRNTTDRKDCLTSTDTIYGSPIAQWLVQEFGRNEDKIIPDWVFDAGVEFCRGLLAGLLCGDGSKTTQLTPKMVLPTTRASLGLQARDIAASLGLGWASFTTKPAGQHYGRNCKECHRVTWNGEAARRLRTLIGLPNDDGGQPHVEKYRLEPDRVLLRIRKIEDGFDVPFMWDLSVAHDDHTFRTPHMAIGNTEVGEWGDEEGFASLKASMSETNPNRLEVYESTAQGLASFFYEMCERAKDSVSTRFIFVGWWRDEKNAKHEGTNEYRVYWDGKLLPEERKWTREILTEYGVEITPAQIAWWRWKMNEEIGDLDLMYQNYPPTADYAFIASGENFFSTARLTDEVRLIKAAEPPDMFRFVLRDNFQDCDVMETGSKHCNLRVWEHADPKGVYVLGADPAYGSSDWADRFCASVWRCYGDGMVQVAEFCTESCNTYQFAWVILYLAGYYGDTMINLEINGPGQAVFQEMQSMRRMAPDNPSNPIAKQILKVIQSLPQYLYKRIDTFGRPNAYHSLSNTQFKERMMNLFKDCFERGISQVRSEACIEEMQRVVREEGQLGAPNRGKDDRVIAASLAHVAWTDWRREGCIAKGMLKPKVGGQGELAPLPPINPAMKGWLARVGVKM